MHKHYSKKAKAIIALIALIILFLTAAILKDIVMPPPEISGDFEIHFIDVGQADATLVISNGCAMLVDGGNVGDSSKMYSYLKEMNITHLNYVVATHIHEDHIGGLSGALNFATVSDALCPTEEYDSYTFSNFKKNVEKHGAKITVPSVGDTFMLGEAKVEVLSCNADEEFINDTSIVLKITYGENSFLLMADSEFATEKFMMDEGLDLKCDVLKVGHHGSSTSTSYPFLREALPEYAVISCGKQNDYGHPHEEVTTSLENAGVTIFRTDINGDIICTSDGHTITFKPTKESKPATQQENTTINETVINYVFNTNSHVFHLPECEGVATMSERNKVNLSMSYESALDHGYTPCKMCIHG